VTNVLDPSFFGSAVITTDIASLDIHGPNCTDPVGPGKIVFREHRDQNHASEHWYTWRAGPPALQPKVASRGG
jgi:hypothetical protein